MTQARQPNKAIIRSSRRLAGAALFSGRFLPGAGTSSYFRPAAVFHRHHHSNEHPVGGTKIRHAEEPVSAAGTALRSYYLWPSHACSRHKLLAPGPPSCSQCPSRPPQAKERGKSVQNSPSTPPGHSDIVAKCQTAFRKIAEWSLSNYGG